MFQLTEEGFRVTLSNGFIYTQDDIISYDKTPTGFIIHFSGKVAFSTQFGMGHYCANRFGPYTTPPPDSPDAEIAIFEEDGDWLTRQWWKKVFGRNLNDDVHGRTTSEEWEKIFLALLHEYEKIS